MYLFPKFSSFFMFIIMFSTSLLLFTHIINETGIICILLLMYLLLLIGDKVTSLGFVAFTISTCISICDIKLIYDVLPKILFRFSNCLLFFISHIYLIHYAAIIFVEFGMEKLRKEDLTFFSELSIVFYITFPLLISTIWSYAASFFVSFSVIPFVFQFLIFFLYQFLIRTGGNSEFLNSDLGKRKEMTSVICLVQFLSGIVVHIGLLGLFHSLITWPRMIIDSLAISSLSVLLTGLLPISHQLESSGILSNRWIKFSILFSGIACYSLILPLLHAHGIHFHTARFMFFKILLLSSGFLSIVMFPRKWVVSISSIVAVLVMIFLWELPWGIQLLPRTFFLLERIYFCVLLMSLSALLASHFLVTIHKDRKKLVLFQASLIILITVFHIAEWSLFFTHLTQIPFVFLSGAIVLVAELCLSIGSRISPITAAFIDSQLFVKLVILGVHCSTGNLITLPILSIIGCFIIGFIISHSLRQTSLQSFYVSFIKSIILFIGILTIRDPVIMILMYGITGEDILIQPNVLQCLVLSLLMDFIINTKFNNIYAFDRFSAVRAISLVMSIGLLVNLSLSLGVMFIGIYSFLRDKDDKWAFDKVLSRSVTLATGCVLLLMIALDMTILDCFVMMMMVTNVHAIFELSSQPSIRVFKRYFMRIWIIGTLISVIALVLGSNVNCRYLIFVGFHFTVAFLLSKRCNLLEVNLDSNLTDLKRFLRKIQNISVGQCLVGGIIACRLNFSCPQVFVLPIVLLWFDRYECICEYSSKQVDVVSLITSSLAWLLIVSTIQQSPLVLANILNTAQELSLQLDLAVNVQAWFEIALSSLLGVCHSIMLVLSVISLTPHNCTNPPQIDNLDCYLICYTAVIPISLGFIFCSTSFSSVGLAFLSLSAGVRTLLL